MEQALILVVLTSQYPKGLPDILKKIKGVIDANFVYGPYDLYAIVKTETKAQMRDIVTKIRETQGISSTMTCHVMEA